MDPLNSTTEPPKSAPSLLEAYVRLLRPRQMTKNLFCLAGVFFSGRFVNPEDRMSALLAFFAFCLGSSAVYVLNDIVDRERDRQHPRKRTRPIASGAVGVAPATVLALLLSAGSLALAWWLGTGTLVCLLLYMTNNLAYSFGVKHIPLLDVMTIAFGFVLRLLAGVYAVNAIPTTWIVLCTYFLTLFVGFSKRRAELADLSPHEEQTQRPVLTHYTVGFLDHLVNNSAVMTVMCYALFTILSKKSASLVVTVPLVFFVVMHYKRRVLMLNEGEEPERTLLRDRWLQGAVLCWFVLYALMEHYQPNLFE